MHTNTRSHLPAAIIKFKLKICMHKKKAYTHKHADIRRKRPLLCVCFPIFQWHCKWWQKRDKIIISFGCACVCDRTRTNVRGNRDFPRVSSRRAQTNKRTHTHSYKFAEEGWFRGTLFATLVTIITTRRRERIVNYQFADINLTCFNGCRLNILYVWN